MKNTIFTWRRILSGLAFGSYLIWELFLSPIWTISVERWAQNRKIDETLNEQAESIPEFTMPEWIVEWVDFLTGPFGTGFVFATIAFGFWDLWAYCLSRPFSWFKSWRARNKTGLVPLRIKENNFSTKELHQDGKRINLSHAVGTIAGFQPPLASVLVQSGYADYYVFWDAWNHNRYQKLCRGIEFKVYDVFPNEVDIETLEQSSKP